MLLTILRSVSTIPSSQKTLLKAERIKPVSIIMREFRQREISNAQTEHRPISNNHNSQNLGQHERPAFTEVPYGRHSQPRQQTERTQFECCMKCRLSNHTTFECKHQKQVRCFKCHCYGHKDSSGLCWDIK